MAHSICTSNSHIGSPTTVYIVDYTTACTEYFSPSHSGLQTTYDFVLEIQVHATANGEHIRTAFNYFIV